jgi:hypothetical protein
MKRIFLSGTHQATLFDFQLNLSEKAHMGIEDFQAENLSRNAHTRQDTTECFLSSRQEGNSAALI